MIVASLISLTLIAAGGWLTHQGYYLNTLRPFDCSQFQSGGFECTYLDYVNNNSYAHTLCLSEDNVCACIKENIVDCMPDNYFQFIENYQEQGYTCETFNNGNSLCPSQTRGIVCTIDIKILCYTSNLGDPMKISGIVLCVLFPLFLISFVIGLGCTIDQLMS